MQGSDEPMMTISASLRNVITFTGAGGGPVLVIDCDRRRIDVGEGVEVSEAAREVLRILRHELFGRSFLPTEEERHEELYPGLPGKEEG